MKTTIHETNNPFSTFALRGGRLRKRGRGVVSYAPFLTAAASAVVLGSMLALSTPSFADEGDMVVCSDMDSSIVTATGTSTNNYAGVFLISPIRVTDRKDMNMATNQDMNGTVMGTDYYSTDSYSFYTNNDGFHKTMITTSMDTPDTPVNAKGRTGVSFYRVGDGTICLDNDVDISGAGYGIQASHDGTGILGISNEGAITDAMLDGISAFRSGNGDINISSSNGEIGAHVVGIYAKHSGNEGGINIENSSQITVTSTNNNVNSNGIEIKHSGTGDIDVENFSQITVTSTGASVKSNGFEMKHTGEEGHINIENSSSISARDNGIYALHTGAGEGDIGITLKSGSSVAAGDKGIYAKRGGGGSGRIQITLEGGATTLTTASEATDRGIKVRHEGDGLIDIDIDISSERERGSLVKNVESWGKGLFVERKEGAGDVDIDIGGSVWGWKHGVAVKHKGTGNVNISTLDKSWVFGEWYAGILVDRTGGGEGGKVVIDIGGESSDDFQGDRPREGVEAINGDGIRVVNVGSQEIDINVSGEVTSRNGTAIFASNNDGGPIKIDISGRISSGGDNDDYAVSMRGNGTKTLILRPGFSLEGSGKVASSGEGESILKLAANESGVASTVTSNVVHLDKLSGFKSFIGEGVDPWTVTGISPGEFENVRLAGILRFLNARVKMTENAMLSAQGTLEIEGANTLEGGLTNGRGGEVVFENGGTLEVTGNYEGRGKLFFKLEQDGTRGWETQGLTINGKIKGIRQGIVHPVVIRITGRTGLNLGEGDSPWLVQHTHDQASDDHRDVFSFGGVEVDGQIDSSLVTTVTDDGKEKKQVTLGTNVYIFDFKPNDDNDDTNRWYLRRKGSTMASSPPANLPSSLPPIRTPEVYVDPTTGPTGGLGFRGGVRGHAGGLWAQQTDSRTLQEAGGAADGRLHTESDGVRLGFDLPAQGFMGGDVVLGAGVLQELSVSEISSPEGKGFIGLESHAALLTASWSSPAGFYADGQTRYVRFTSDLSAEGLSLVRDNEGTSMDASSELGYRFAVPLGGVDFEIVPQVQLAWSRVGFEDYVGPRGGLIELEDGDLMTGRLGLSWDGEWRDIGGSGRIYGGVSLHKPLDGRTAVRATGVLLTSEQSSSVDGKLGLSYEWDDGYSVYGEVEALRQGDVEDVSANLGVSVDF